MLVAGGLGERLGYSGIKLALPVNQLTQSSFLKMYADWILSIQVSTAVLVSNASKSNTPAALTNRTAPL